MQPYPSCEEKQATTIRAAELKVMPKAETPKVPNANPSIFVTYNKNIMCFKYQGMGHIAT